MIRGLRDDGADRFSIHEDGVQVCRIWKGRKGKREVWRARFRGGRHFVRVEQADLFAVLEDLLRPGRPRPYNVAAFEADNLRGIPRSRRPRPPY